MAQCPKCNNLIPFGTIVKSLFISVEKRRRMECPMCEGPLVPTKKTIALITLAGGVPTILTIPTLTIQKWVHSLTFWRGSLAIFILAGLSFALAALVVATMAEFESEPPPKKFYDPDRLD